VLSWREQAERGGVGGALELRGAGDPQSLPRHVAERVPLRELAERGRRRALAVELDAADALDVVEADAEHPRVAREIAGDAGEPAVGRLREHVVERPRDADVRRQQGGDTRAHATASNQGAAGARPATGEQ